MPLPARRTSSTSSSWLASTAPSCGKKKNEIKRERKNWGGDVREGRGAVKHTSVRATKKRQQKKHTPLPQKKKAR